MEENRTPRMTIPTQLVLRALLADPAQEQYGVEIGAAAGLPSGTIHPILARLEGVGWLTSRWEEIDPRAEGRPARRYYQLTPGGIQLARAALRPHHQRHSRARLAANPWRGVMTALMGSRGTGLHRHQRAVGLDEFDGRHRRGQDAVAVAGTVGPGRGRAGHRDVGQGAGVVQRVALRLQLGSQDPVASATGHRHRHGIGIDGDLRRRRQTWGSGRNRRGRPDCPPSSSAPMTKFHLARTNGPLSSWASLRNVSYRHGWTRSGWLVDGLLTELGGKGGVCALTR